MTEYLSVLSSLKSIFPESSWPWAIPAIKHDPLIWKALADQDFFSQVSGLSQEPKDWAPHNLAAIILEQKDFSSLPADLESESQAALSNFLETGTMTSEQQDDFEHEFYRRFLFGADLPRLRASSLLMTPLLSLGLGSSLAGSMP